MAQTLVIRWIEESVRRNIRRDDVVGRLRWSAALDTERIPAQPPKAVFLPASSSVKLAGRVVSVFVVVSGAIGRDVAGMVWAIAGLHQAGTARPKTRTKRSVRHSATRRKSPRLFKCSRKEKRPAIFRQQIDSMLIVCLDNVHVARLEFSGRNRTVSVAAFFSITSSQYQAGAPIPRMRMDGNFRIRRNEMVQEHRRTCRLSVVRIPADHEVALEIRRSVSVNPLHSQRPRQRLAPRTRCQFIEHTRSVNPSVVFRCRAFFPIHVDGDLTIAAGADILAH
jgi:hypothetical protein